MVDLNDVKLLGRVVKDAKLLTTKQGVKIARFTVAVNSAHKDGDGKYESKGNFFPLAVFGDYAEKTSQWLTKGQRLIVDGSLKQSVFEKDGKRQYKTDVVVNKLFFIFDSKTKNANENGEESARTETECEIDQEELYENNYFEDLNVDYLSDGEID